SSSSIAPGAKVSSNSRFRSSRSFTFMNIRGAPEIQWLWFCRGNAGTIGDRCLTIVDNTLRIRALAESVKECRSAVSRALRELTRLVWVSDHLITESPDYPINRSLDLWQVLLFRSPDVPDHPILSTPPAL